jgi:hypothetical protein
MEAKGSRAKSVKFISHQVLHMGVIQTMKLCFCGIHEKTSKKSDNKTFL